MTTGSHLVTDPQSPLCCSTRGHREQKSKRIEEASACHPKLIGEISKQIYVNGLEVTGPLSSGQFDEMLRSSLLPIETNLGGDAPPPPSLIYFEYRDVPPVRYHFQGPLLLSASIWLAQLHKNLICKWWARADSTRPPPCLLESKVVRSLTRTPGGDLGSRTTWRHEGTYCQSFPNLKVNTCTKSKVIRGSALGT